MANGVKVSDYITEQTIVIGEKISIRRFEIYTTVGKVETYIHMGGKVGVMVEANPFTTGESELHDVALQIAAAKPTYITKEDVPAEVIEKEKEILIAQLQNDEKNASKPREILEKIVVGKIGKFYSENCLMHQAFVKDDSLTVEKVVGTKFTVAKFTRWEMGEGLEKRNDDFAAEVAAQSGQN
jgi:elongation factor Ts